jgi:hypothetical protein
MATWSVVFENLTPVAVADATNFTDAGYLALKGGSTTQRINILEVKIGGLAGASAPSQLVLARDSTVGATSLSGGLHSADDPATAALAAPASVFHTSTTKPQRSSTLHLRALGFNAFGGKVQLYLPPDRPIVLLGNTASFGELSISHLSTGTAGLIDAHMVIEPL